MHSISLGLYNAHSSNASYFYDRLVETWQNNKSFVTVYLRSMKYHQGKAFTLFPLKKSWSNDGDSNKEWNVNPRKAWTFIARSFLLQYSPAHALPPNETTPWNSLDLFRVFSVLFPYYYFYLPPCILIRWFKRFVWFKLNCESFIVNIFMHVLLIKRHKGYV